MITDFDKAEAHRWQAALEEGQRHALAEMIAAAREYGRNNWLPVTPDTPPAGRLVLAAGNGISQRLVSRTPLGDWREVNGNPSRPPLVYMDAPADWVEAKPK